MIHFGQNHRQFLLQVALARLVIRVREFTDPVFELEIAEVLVNGSLPIIKMAKRGLRLRFWQIFRSDTKNECDYDNRDDGREDDNH